MITQVASTDDIQELKNKIKSLLETQEGIGLFNQRYGKDFSYRELCEIIDSSKIVWVSYLDKNLIGFAELWDKSNGFPELGYAIFPDYQKMGYGYQLAETAFEDCINKYKLPQIKIEVESNNIGSLSILKKLQKKYPFNKSEIDESYDIPTIMVRWDLSANLKK